MHFFTFFLIQNNILGMFPVVLLRNVNPYIKNRLITRMLPLFNWKRALKVLTFAQNTVLSSEQRKNVTSFSGFLRGWDATSSKLVYYFCKVGCRNYKTRVVI